MALLLTPHRASYTFLGADGAEAGNEELVAEVDGAGMRISSSLATTYPARLNTTLDWQLDSTLTTRRLLISSRNGWDEACELEVTVTGNGLLAHRTAPDGPTQVELGWGANAELDHLSVAFATVMAARSRLQPGRSRRIDTVYIGAEDLLPEIVARELVATAVEDGAIHILNRALETGRTAALAFDPSGALRSYEGLVRLDRLSLLPAPTK